MKRESLSQAWLRPDSWAAVAVLILLAQTVATFVLKQPTSRTAFNAVISMLLLFLATVISAGNAIRNKHAIRLFWSFLAVSWGLWALSPVFWILSAAGMPLKLSEFWLSTVLLFLHTALLIAAVASRPHLRLPSHKPYRATLNFFLLLFFLVFVFAFFLIPYQSMRWDSAAI